MRRPLKEARPYGPFIEYEEGSFNLKAMEDNDSTTANSSTEQDIPHFSDFDDLPDSPMVQGYAKSMKERLEPDVSEEEIANSMPLRDYMKKIGVWEDAIEGQDNGDR